MLRFLFKGTNSMMNWRTNIKRIAPQFFKPLSPAASADFVAVPVQIFINETVELAARDFNFYNCAATVKKWENTPWVLHLIRRLGSVTQPKSADDSEHSAGWQPWCECIAACHQMRDQGSVCKLWCMLVCSATPCIFLPPRCLLRRRGNCLSFPVH